MSPAASSNTKKDILLVNVIEEFVKSKASEALKSIGACDCEACRLSVCALALNKLPPKYVTTTKGEMLAQLSVLNLSSQTEVLVEVTKAAMLVKEQPRHE